MVTDPENVQNTITETPQSNFVQFWVWICGENVKVPTIIIPTIIIPTVFPPRFIYRNNGTHGPEEVFHATGQIGLELGSIMQLHSDCFNQSQKSSMQAKQTIEME